MSSMPIILAFEKFRVKARVRGKKKLTIENFVAGIKDGFHQQKFRRYANNITDFKYNKDKKIEYFPGINSFADDRKLEGAN